MKNVKEILTINIHAYKRYNAQKNVVFCSCGKIAKYDVEQFPLSIVLGNLCKLGGKCEEKLLKELEFISSGIMY